jgi:hypothetical protein
LFSLLLDRQVAVHDFILHCQDKSWPCFKLKQIWTTWQIKKEEENFITFIFIEEDSAEHCNSHHDIHVPRIYSLEFTIHGS